MSSRGGGDRGSRGGSRGKGGELFREAPTKPEQETRTAREAAGEAIELACPRVTGDRAVLSQSESDLLADAVFAALDAAGWQVVKLEWRVLYDAAPATPEGGDDER